MDVNIIFAINFLHCIIINLKNVQLIVNHYLFNRRTIPELDNIVSSGILSCILNLKAHCCLVQLWEILVLRLQTIKYWVAELKQKRWWYFATIKRTKQQLKHGFVTLQLRQSSNQNMDSPQQSKHGFIRNHWIDRSVWNRDNDFCLLECAC